MNTWPADMWKHGGGTVWGWISYDPELNLVYYGTANPGPWDSSMAPGRQQCGPLASSPATPTRDRRGGSIKRARTICTDYDGVNEPVLVDSDLERQDAQGSRPPRPQWLRLHNGSRQLAKYFRRTRSHRSPPAVVSI